MLDIKRFALAGGILTGLCIFIVTLVSVGNGYAGEWLKLLESVFPGYHVTLVGSVVGLVYGFVDGFVKLGIFAWVYNKLADYVK